jgi:mRNA-degrading endonuclease RelE of RelBE toxin-antitoxin system
VAYRLIVLPSAETDLEKLDIEPRRRILRRLVWLGENASQVVHHQLANMPEELLGLCRLRVGDYRILYWPYRQQEVLKVYRIQHRSEVYRRI